MNKKEKERNIVIFRLITTSLLFLLILISITPAQAILAEATEEQLKVMNEIEGSDITIGEYLQKAWPQFYDELTEEQKVRVSHWKRGWPKDPVNIEENQTNWHSQNITSYTTALNINLKWKNPSSNLSLKVYSPEGRSFGPFYDNVNGLTNGQIYFFIRRECGLPMGEWWYAVEGKEINGTQKYYF